MSGGQRWHWIAAGVAGLAVVGAVLADGKTEMPTLSAHPFPTVQFYPQQNGGVIAATPTLDPTTVTKTTPRPKPPPPPAPDPSEPPHTDTKITVPLTPSDFLPPDFPLYFEDCDIAKALGYAPIYKGEPGYRPQLDKDHDGIACE